MHLFTEALLPSIIISLLLIEKSYYKFDEPIFNATADIVSGKRPLQAEEIKDPDQYLTPEEKDKVGEYMGPRKIEGYWGKCLEQSGLIKNSMGSNDQELLKH